MTSSHATYLDRARERLDELEATLADLGIAVDASGDEAARRRVAGLRASLEVMRDQHRELRREGAELSEERTRSFNAGLERLGAGIGELRRQTG